MGGQGQPMRSPMVQQKDYCLLEKLVAFALLSSYPFGYEPHRSERTNQFVLYLTPELISITTQLWSEYDKQTWG